MKEFSEGKFNSVNFDVKYEDMKKEFEFSVTPFFSFNRLKTSS
jgi:hypothetical protein